MSNKTYVFGCDAILAASGHEREHILPSPTAAKFPFGKLTLTQPAQVATVADNRIVVPDEALGGWTSGQLVLQSGDRQFTAQMIRSKQGGELVDGLAFDALPPINAPLDVACVDLEATRRDDPAGQRFEHVCFTPGSAILTVTGLKPVEALEVGDFVITRDRGPQPLRWVGRHKLTPETLRAHPELTPVLLKKGSIAPGVPARDLMISPNHRLLLNDWRAELLFGTTEVLAPAHALINDHSILRCSWVQEIDYIHLVFDQHEIIRADGIEAESFLPSPKVLSTLDVAVQAELFRLFPNLMFGRCGDAARRMLQTEETEALRAV